MRAVSEAVAQLTSGGLGWTEEQCSRALHLVGYSKKRFREERTMLCPLSTEAAARQMPAAGRQRGASSGGAAGVGAQFRRWRKREIANSFLSKRKILRFAFSFFLFPFSLLRFPFSLLRFPCCRKTENFPSQRRKDFASPFRQAHSACQPALDREVVAAENPFSLSTRKTCPRSTARSSKNI